MRQFIPFLIAFLFLNIACQQEPPHHFDILIKNGKIIDGTGKTAYQADIGILNDTIAFIGKGRLTAEKEIDAKGYYISPGFIDSHTHAMSDLSDSVKNANLNYLLQGVTTVVTGSDGNSVLLIGDKLKEWETNGIGTNAAIMVGHRTIRQRVMSMRDESPTEDDMHGMKTLVERGMDEGALGFSTGLYYAPASFASTEEVIELSKVAAAKGGIYDAHIRDESSYNIGLIAAIEESIEIARKANIPVNISHIKCLGVDVWDKSDEVIALIQKAQNEGLKITADQYPYRASGTHLNRALVPKWVYADAENFQDKFDDPKLLPRIKKEMAENMRRRGGAEALLIVFSEDKSIERMTLAEIAKKWEMEEIETAIKIIKNGSAAVASFNMQDSDIQNFMKQDWIMTCSDGTNAHPRKYGTFPKKIREYVLEKKTLSLEEMIRKSTSLTASTFGIQKRGEIKAGYYADILIFKPEELKDNATFEIPNQLSEGMKWIIINGKLVVENGIYNKKLVGRSIRR